MLNKIVLITGANRGIGKEAAKQLLKKGHKVIIASRDLENGKDTVDELSEYKGKPFLLKLDVTKNIDLIEAVEVVGENFGKLDVLINNAGVFMDRYKKTENLNMDVLRNTLETNLVGAVNTTINFLPLLKKSAFAHIINISSRMGQLKYMQGGSAAYRISKTALNSFTRILANEFEKEKLVINSMSPGWVKTELGGPMAERSLAKGAETIVWLAEQTRGFTTGGFYMDMEKIEW